MKDHSNRIMLPPDTHNNVECAVTAACDILCLAIKEDIRFKPEGNRAITLIRATMYYLDDIGALVNFIDGWAVADGGAA